VTLYRNFPNLHNSYILESLA